MSAYVGIWVGLHFQVARLTGTPELAISEGDGKAFLSAVQNVARHYPITATQKTLDWAALAFTAGFIYAPRFAAVSARRKRGEQQARPGPTGPAEVFQFRRGTAREAQPAPEPAPPPEAPGPAPDMTYEPELDPVA